MTPNNQRYDCFQTMKDLKIQRLRTLDSNCHITSVVSQWIKEARAKAKEQIIPGNLSSICRTTDCWEPKTDPRTLPSNGPCENRNSCFHLFLVWYYLKGTWVMSKHWKGFKKHCFAMFMREPVLNMKTAMETLRNSLSLGTSSNQNLMILKNFQYWSKVLVCYKQSTCSCLSYSLPVLEFLNFLAVWKLSFLWAVSLKKEYVWKHRAVQFNWSKISTEVKLSYQFNFPNFR